MLVVAGKVGVFMELLEGWEDWESRPPVPEVLRRLADKLSCGRVSPTIMEEVRISVNVLCPDSCDALRW